MKRWFPPIALAADSLPASVLFSPSSSRPPVDPEPNCGIVGLRRLVDPAVLARSSFPTEGSS